MLDNVCYVTLSVFLSLVVLVLILVERREPKANDQAITNKRRAIGDQQGDQKLDNVESPFDWKSTFLFRVNSKFLPRRSIDMNPASDLYHLIMEVRQILKLPTNPAKGWREGYQAQPHVELLSAEDQAYLFATYNSSPDIINTITRGVATAAEPLIRPGIFLDKTRWVRDIIDPKAYLLHFDRSPGFSYGGRTFGNTVDLHATVIYDHTNSFSQSVLEQARDEALSV